MKAKFLVLLLALTFAISACSSPEKAKGEGDSDQSANSESVAEESNASSQSEEKSEQVEESAESAQSEEIAGAVELHLHRSYLAPNGDRGFARLVVALADDKVVDVVMDEYEYFEEGGFAQPLPNDDGAFGEGAAEGKFLGSKLDNNEGYSANMKEKAGSTVAFKDNIKAIVDFASGKTVADLEKVLSTSEAGKPVDGVTGATLADTYGYLQFIVEAAK